VTEKELYDELLELFSKMMTFEDKNEYISDFTLLVKGIAVEIADYENKIRRKKNG
jgi:hypothetical protein